MSLVFRSAQFEGPLELLLRLTQEKKLSINEISLAQVTEEYFSHLTTLEEKLGSAHDELAEFLVIASTLLLIKSKSLLPGFHLTEEEEEDIGDLELRLKEYKRFKELAVFVEHRLSGEHVVAMRPPFVGVAEDFLPPKTFDFDALPDQLRRLLDVLTKKPALPEKQVRRVISIEEKIKRIEERIQNGIRSFSAFIEDKKDPTEVIVSFLALLELVRHRSLDVSQSEQFGDILVNTQHE